MPTYKLTYFNARGRAELPRLVFAVAGAEYVDNRIEGKDWPGLKPNTPTGTVPTLEVDGKTTVSQSQAIARYLAREFNLAGDNNLQMLQCEQVQETFVDLSNDTIPIFMEKDAAKKAELAKSVYQEKTKTKLGFLDKMLADNGGAFFVGNKLTLAELSLFAAFERILAMMGNDAVKDFPKLAAHHEKVGKDPKIAAWVAKRPETPF